MEIPEVVQQTIIVEEVRVFYDEYVPDEQEGVPVLYVHGNLGSKRWFSRVMEVDRRRVIALDLPNFGASDPLGSCSIAAYGEFLVKFIAALNLEQVVLVGHSLGGAVAMEAAVTAPQIVAGLYLLDSSPVTGLITPKEHYPIIESYKSNRQLLAAALKAVVPTLEDNEFFQKLVDDARKMEPVCYIGHAESLGKADFSKRVSGYSGPVHAAAGTEDILIKEKDVKNTAEAFGGSYELFPGVGHSVIVEDPEVFLKSLNKFLADIR